MSTTVDNRVIKMVFDNAQFETAIKSTMDTLAKFEKSLSFENISSGFEGITKAANKVDLGNISESAAKEVGKLDTISAEAAASIDKIDDSAQNADFSPLSKSAVTAMNDVNAAIAGLDISSIYTETQQAGEGFTAFSGIALGALMEVGAGIENYVISKLKGVVGQITGPIKEGFGEYETQIGAIQTIIANTGMDFDSDDDIAKVNAKLDELNTYADKTVYKFSDMVNAIGRFTASGLDLDKSTQAVQGVANVAALAGASMSDVSRVLPQLAQALSSGHVSMQDWFSVETANMNSKIFVDTIADVAMHMAEVGKAEQSAYEAGNAILNQGVTMRSALNKSDNKQWADWFSSDILANSLQLFTYDRRSMAASEVEEAKNYFRSLGYTTEEEFNKLFDQATMAQRAAQEVRTFSQLMDTLGESIGSNWTGIWRNFIGDFKQATSTFTLLSQTLSGGIDALFAGVNNAALVFNKSGGWQNLWGNDVFEKDEVTGKIQKTGDRILGALDYILEAIGKPLSSIGDAFHKVFGFDDKELGDKVLGNFFLNATQGIKDFAASLVISDDAAKGLSQVFEGVFSIVDLGLHAIADAGTILGGVIETVRVFLDPIVDIIIAIAGQAGKLVSWAHDKILEVRDAIIEVLTPLDNIRKAILEIISSFIDSLDIPGKIDLVGNGLLGILELLWQLIDIPGKIRGLADILSNIVGFIGDITGWNAAVAEANATFEQTGEKVSVVDIWIKKLLENPIIKFFADIASVLLSPIAKLGEFALGFLKLDEAGRQAKVAEILEDIKSKTEFITTPLSNLFEALKNFFGAIGEFGIKVFDALTKFQPFVDFGNSVQNFFTELPGKLSEIGGTIAWVVGGITNPIDTVTNWLNEKAEYFRTVTVDQFITDLKNSINGFFTDIQKFVTFITTLSPQTLLQQWNSFVDGFESGGDRVATSNLGVQGSILAITEAIDSQFPMLNNGVTNTFKGIVNGIDTILTPALAKSKSIPEIFVNIFLEIKNRLAWFIGETKEAILNFKPEDLFQGWLNIKGVFLEFINSVFPSLSGVASGALNSFTNFLISITSGTTTWEQVFNRVLGGIKEGVSKLPEIFFTVIDEIRKGLTKALAFITGQLAMLPGVGEFFGGLSETFTNMSKMVGAPKKAAEMFNSITEFGSDLATKSAFTNLTGIDLLGSVKKWVDEQIAKLPDVIKDVPAKIGEFINGLKEAFDKVSIEQIIDVIQTLILGKLLISVSSVISGIGDITKSVSKVIERFGKDDPFEQLGNAFLKVAGSMAIVAGALYVVSMIDNVQECIDVIERLGLFIVALQFLSAKINELVGKGGGTQMLSAAASLGVLALDMLVAMKAIEKLNEFDWAGNTVGIIAGIAMLAVFGTFIAAVTHFGGEGGGGAVSVAASILAVVAAMYLLLPAFEMLNEYVNSKLDGLTGDKLNEGIKKLVVSFGLLSGMLLSVGLAMRLAGDHALSAGIGIAIASVGVDNLANALVKVAAIDTDTLGNATICLLGLLAVFGAITAWTSGTDLIASSLAIGVFSIALVEMSAALTSLSEIDTDILGNVTICLSGLLVVLGAITEWTSGGDLIASSAAMVIFGASIIEMSVGLKSLAEIDTDILGNVTICLSGLMVVLGAITEWTSGADLVASSAAMVIFGAAVIEMSMGLEALTKLDTEKMSWAAIALVSLTAALGAITEWTNGVDLLTSSAAMIIFAGALGNIATALIELTKVDSDDMQTAAWALGLLSGALAAITAVTNAVDLIGTAAGLDLFAVALMGIATSILIFAEALNQMPDGDTIRSIGVNIFAGIGEGIAEGAKAVVQGILDIGGMILDAIKEFFGIHSPSTLMQEEIGQYIPAGIAEGITGNTGDISTALSGVADGVLNWVQTDGVKMLGDAANSAMNWVQTEGPGKFQEFLNWAGERGKELAGKFSAWMQSDGIPMLTQAGKDAWGWVTTDGVKLFTDFLGWLKDKGGELVGKFGEWMESDGIPMLTQAASDIWDWVCTDGVALVGQFLGWLGEQAVELGGKIKDWFLNTAIPWVGDRLGEVLDSILGWLKELPGNMLETITSIDWGEIGDNIVQGVAAGITGGTEWITNALTGLGDSALQGIKDFFGIQSPSTVMRDEVGINLAKGIGVGIKNGWILQDDLWAFMRDNIKEEASAVLKDVDMKDIVHQNLTSLQTELMNDADINDIIETIGRYFPEKTSEALLKSPALYVKNATPDYLDWLKMTIYDIADEGYTYVDEALLESEGKLDSALYNALQYLNGSMGSYLQESDSYINNQLEITSHSVADGMYEAGLSIPQAFTQGLADGFSYDNTPHIFTNYQKTIHDLLENSSMPLSLGQRDPAKQQQDVGILNGLTKMEDIMKFAAERLPKVFTEEFQKHVNDGIPLVKSSLEDLLGSVVPDLSDEQVGYVTSIVSAGEMVTDVFDRNIVFGLRHEMEEGTLTLDDISKTMFAALPENMASGIMEHANLPQDTLLNIFDSMRETTRGALLNDYSWYITNLTEAYSRIVDAFYYEIDNAKDVEELGEIIGKYFPEGMGTGIVENRDVPMQEMIENLKWMAANGQLAIPGFNQMGSDLGLEVSDGIVKGLFADFGSEGPAYLTDYANQVKAQTGVIHEAGTYMGDAISEGVNTQLSGQDGLAQGVNSNLYDLNNLATVPAQQVGTTVGESITTGTATGVDGLGGTVSGAVNASESEATKEGTEVGKSVGKAIVDGMNEQINNKESGLIATLKTAGDEVVTQAEKLGNAIADGVKRGITEGFKSKDEGSITDVLTSDSTKKNIFTSFGSIGKVAGGLSKEDLESLKTNEYKIKLVKVEPDSKTILTEILQGVITEGVKTASGNNKTNITTAGGELVKTLTDTNKININTVLTELKYAETLNTIDGNIKKINDIQVSNQDALIKKLEELKSNQDDMYSLIKNTTNGHLDKIEDNTGKDMNIYMDTGALVGAISDQMDQALGYRQMLSDRGSN